MRARCGKGSTAKEFREKLYASSCLGLDSPMTTAPTREYVESKLGVKNAQEIFRGGPLDGMEHLIFFCKLQVKRN